MQFSDIRADVRSRIDESAASFWTDTEINRWINQRYHQAVLALRDIAEDFFLATTQINLVNGTQEYALPSDFLALRKAEISYDAVVWRRMRPVRQNDIPLQNDATVVQGSQFDPAYYLSAKNIGVAPIPTASVTNGLKLWYIQDVVDLSADGDVPNLPTALHFLLGKLAAGDALKKDEEDVRGAALISEATGELRTLLGQLKPRQEDQPRYVNYIDDAGFPQVRR